MHTIDTLFYIHPDLSEDQRISLEEMLSTTNGILHANLDRKNSHELSVSYDPDAVSSDTIRKQIRDWDKDARIVNL